MEDRIVIKRKERKIYDKVKWLVLPNLYIVGRIMEKGELKSGEPIYRIIPCACRSNFERYKNELPEDGTVVYAYKVCWKIYGTFNPIIKESDLYSEL